MASWRRLQAQREARDRWRERGMEVVCWFVGGVVGGALILLGIHCFLADAVPLASRRGLLWVSDHRKTGCALATLGLGCALNFGMIWSRVRYLRIGWLPGLVLSLGSALTGGMLLVAG